MDLALEPEHMSESSFGRAFRILKEQPRLTSVDRLSGLAVEEFLTSFAAESLPVLLEGLVPTRIMDPLEATRILRAAIGEEVVTVRYGSYAQPPEYTGQRLTKRLTVNEFLSDMDIDATVLDSSYLANQVLPSKAVEMLGISSPSYYSGSDFRPPRMWIGSGGCTTPLHKDSSDNFSLQIFGTKRWVMFPVRDYPFLYLEQPKPKDFPGFSCSRVDVGSPDHERFPLFHCAQALEVEVSAGDTLYLPAGWSHYVETLSNSMMVNFWMSAQRLPACLERRPLPKL
jgi:hypothetical protein